MTSMGPFIRLHRPSLAASLLVLLLALAACAGAGPRAPSVPGHSIDLSAMDRAVRPGDDFFLFANGAWLARTQIPPDRTHTGVDMRMTEEVERRTKALLDEAARGGAPAGSDVQRMGDYYASFLDETAIEAGGIAPLAPEMGRIAKIEDARGLAEYLGSTLRADVDVLNWTDLETGNVLGLWVEQDLNDPSTSAPYLLQGGLGMSNRVYYVDETPPHVAVRAAYLRYLTAVLELAGVPEAGPKAARALALERKLAEAHATRTDTGDVSKGNNPWLRSEFATRAPGLDWDTFFRAAALEARSFIVWQPRAVAGLASLAKSEPLDVWRDYLVVRAIERMISVLPRAFVDLHFAFYGKELDGAEAQSPRWRRAAEATNDAVGEAVARAYVGKYFPAEAKRAAQDMVAEVVAAFGRRVDKLAWMRPATKAKAREKLGTLKVGVGYPDKWRDYAALSVVRGDAFGNLERARQFEYRRNVAKIGRPADRDEWAMLPHVVNAVNLPIRNALNIPAAILTPPLFDPRATAAANYGATGATIGHEISHSFDDQGAKFDARGRYANWWTPEDLTHFAAAGQALAAQFSAYRPFPDLAVDGKMTLSENIADLAGLAAAYDAWRASLRGAEAPEQDGLTGDQQFFVAYAQSWQSKLRDEKLRDGLLTGGHAPPRYRALTVRNLDVWYEAFQVQPGDALFLAPGSRVSVW